MQKALITATFTLGLALSAAPGQPPTDTLKGAITANLTLDSTKIWIIQGFVTVDSPAVLAIKPGTWIKGQKSTKGTLAIRPGAKILAEGTADKPITFTSDEADGLKTRGSWGGLVMLGRAKTNLPISPTLPKFEARDDWMYGGTNDDDSSGVLKYVRIENPGFPVAPDKELNGLTMATLGRKTVISHVHVHNGDDDGFEFFGGSVNADHLVVTNQVDDGFDSDNGFSGTVRNIINIQGTDADRVRTYIVKTGSGADSVVTLPNEVVGDKCFESSSTKLSTGDALPQTMPTWVNVTCIDNGKSGGGINLNEHAVGAFDRMILIGDSSAYAVRLQSSKTNAGLLANPATLKFTKSYLGGTFKSKFITDDASNEALIQAGLANVLKSLDKTLYKDLGPANDTLKNDSVGAVLGDKPEDFWYKGWVMGGSLTWAKGADREPIGVRRDPAAAGPDRLFSIGMSGKDLVIHSVFNALVSLEVKDISGKRRFVRDGVKLAVGANHLGRPWGALPAGGYLLVVRSGDYSVHHRLNETGSGLSRR